MEITSKNKRENEYKTTSKVICAQQIFVTVIILSDNQSIILQVSLSLACSSLRIR